MVYYRQKIGRAWSDDGRHELWYKRLDHSFDHLRLRTTWKQCEREYPKAPFSDLKARKKRKNHAKNRYRFVWDVDAAGSNPVTPTISSVHN